MLHPLPAVLLFPALFVARAQAQCPAFLPEFRAHGLDGEVVALATFDDGTGPALFAGGSFSLAGTVRSQNLARWNGTSWSSVGDFDGAVRALAVLDDGSGPALYAGGAFTHAGGVPAARIARWNGTSWSPLGVGFDDREVRSLRVYDEGAGPRLFAGGAFSTSGGADCAGIARFDGTTWSEVGGGLIGYANPTPPTVRALVVHDDGTGPGLYAGGPFFRAGGLAVHGIARWNGTQWSHLGPGGLGMGVEALATFTEGGIERVYAGGSFTSSNGVPLRYVARWEGNTWAQVGDWTPGFVQALRVFDDGSGPALWAGARANYSTIGLGRWDGSNWTYVESCQRFRWVNALEVFDDGTGPALHWGGLFDRIGSDMAPVAPRVRHVARLDGGVAEGLGPHFGLSAMPRCVASFDAGAGTELYAAGDFGWAGAEPIAHLARWNGTGWSAVPTGAAPPDGSVRALLARGPVSAGELVAAGAFTTIGGVAANGVARFDGTIWTPLGAGVGNGAWALAAYDDGGGEQVYAAGALLLPPSMETASVARWNGTEWSSVASLDFFDGRVRVMEVYAGKLFVGLDVQFGGPWPSSVACFDGSSWTFPPLGPDGTVTDLLVADEIGGPVLYAAGDIPTAGGGPAYNVARWNGTAWAGAGPVSVAGFTNAVAWYDDGSGPALYAAGRYLSYSNSHLLRRTAGVWASVDEPYLPQEEVLTMLAVHDDGTGRGPALYAAGDTIALGGVLGDHLNVYRGCRIATFCAGDGLDPQQTTPCPCGNTGASGHGCAWSGNPAGALLAASGSLQRDTLILDATAMPVVAPTTVFWKSDLSSGNAVPWGDGLRCLDGNLLRLGTKNNVGGAARYPEAGNASISVRGATPPGSGQVAHYQTSFRNAANFCTPFTYNATNGVRIVW